MNMLADVPETTIADASNLTPICTNIIMMTRFAFVILKETATVKKGKINGRI